MASTFDTEFEAPEMETLSSLAENIVYLLPGCTDVMVRKTLQDVYRDFCRRSCCLHERRHLDYSGHTVTFAPRYGGIVDCVCDVFVNGHPIGDGEYQCRGGIVHLSRRYVPREDETNEIDALVVEMPRINSEDVPSWFVQRYGEGICSGVLSRLMMMTGRAWSDAQQGSVNLTRYENAVNEARIRYYAQSDSGDLGRATDFADELL